MKFHILGIRRKCRRTYQTIRQCGSSYVTGHAWALVRQSDGVICDRCKLAARRHCPAGISSTGEGNDTANIWRNRRLRLFPATNRRNLPQRRPNHVLATVWGFRQVSGKTVSTNLTVRVNRMSDTNLHLSTVHISRDSMRFFLPINLTVIYSVHIRRHNGGSGPSYTNVTTYLLTYLLTYLKSVQPVAAIIASIMSCIQHMTDKLH